MKKINKAKKSGGELLAVNELFERAPTKVTNYVLGLPEKVLEVSYASAVCRNRYAMVCHGIWHAMAYAMACHGICQGMPWHMPQHTFGMPWQA